MTEAVKSFFSLKLMWPTQDPFLFCAYHFDRYPKGNKDLGPADSLSGRPIGNDFDPDLPWRMYHGNVVPGFPQHPHRGFETVTIVNQGFCDHSDSLGAAGRFGHGDVQWMTAGKGVLHAEMFPLLREDRDNPLQLFQIWLNLPAKNKLVPPHFKMLWSEEIPILEEDGVTIQLVAGKYGDAHAAPPPPDSWAADPDNGVNIMIINLEKESEFIVPTTNDAIGRSLYFFEGDRMELNGEIYNSLTGFVLDPAQSVKLKSVAGPVSCLLLEGRPIEEPIAKHGPFVMNTHDEIRDAMREYGRTEFGGWPWPNNGPVHGKDRGRFALYPDGKLVEKEID